MKNVNVDTNMNKHNKNNDVDSIINSNTNNENYSNKPKAISIFSGGLDSTVATAFYGNGYDIHAITFDYGQNSLESEINAVKAICSKLNMKNTIIDLDWLSKIGNSALTSSSISGSRINGNSNSDNNGSNDKRDLDVPLLSDSDLDDIDICRDSASKVWVPGRNTIFVAIGLAFAEAEGAEIIIVGWDNEEAATFPDNSKEFLESYNETIANGSINDKIMIKAPLIDLDKKEIVELGSEIEAPLEFSYSCYVGEEVHCGSCESCLRRIRAFKTANIKDKTIYKNKT